MKVSEVEITKLPKYGDNRGNLSVAEQQKDVPFEIKRCFWMYGVPEGKGRGGHAHKTLQQFVIPMNGSFEITLDDGKETRTFLLDSPDRGLLIDTGVWADLKNFSADAVCLVLASDVFKEEDYLGTREEFAEYLSQKEKETYR